MFVRRLEDGRPHVLLSYSAFDLWLNCPLKACLQYKHNLGSPRRAFSEDDYAAKPKFGSAAHVALPHWSLTGDLESSFDRFDQAFDVPLEKEYGLFTRERGHALIRTYASRYGDDDGNDRLAVVHINQEPQVEKRNTFVLVDDDEIFIEFEVILDSMVIDHDQRGVWVKDIKTTTMSIGETEPWFRCQTNSDQWIPYILSAKTLYEGILEIPVLGVCLDAIYTRRTKFEPADLRRNYFEVGGDIPSANLEKYPNQVKEAAKSIVRIWEDVKPIRNPSYCMAYMKACKFLPYCHVDIDDMPLGLMEAAYEPYYQKD